MKYIYLFAFCLIIISGCKKDWLEEKPELSLAVPTSLRDVKALLSGTTNGGSFLVDFGSLQEHSAGDFYVSDDVFMNSEIIDKSFYSWNSDLWEDDNESAWLGPYIKIEYTNVALESLADIVPENPFDKQLWNELKGTALFFRAVFHYDVARQFAKGYNKSTADQDLGIPLRLTADFNVKSTRPNINETYKQIVNDLTEASALLPIKIPENNTYKCQPTVVAAYAMLARVYLSMSDYENAKSFSDKALQLYNKLLNYSTADTTSVNPFERFNDEVIFHMTGGFYVMLANSADYPIVDSSLYQMYDDNDLRKQLFFRDIGSNMFTFKNGYAGDANIPFVGLAVDELYLIRAECNARAGNIAPALDDLNTLLKARWKDDGSWAPASASNADDLLKLIIAERRKELCFRCIRWDDLKRLNQDPAFQTTLTKTILGQTKTLPPNSPLYVFSIPPQVIVLSGIQQNER